MSIGLFAEHLLLTQENASDVPYNISEPYFNEKVPEPEVVYLDMRMDPETAVHYFGLLSISMASFMPLIWVFLMKESADLGTTGYKVGSYISMIFAAPYSFVYLIWLLLPTRTVA